MKRDSILYLLLTGVLMMPLSGLAGKGIAGKQAPEIAVEQWFQLPEGKESISIDDYKGKVVYLFCFQSWCPGCHTSGFPALAKLIKDFKRDKDVVFLAVQTVFEGFRVNTPKMGLDTAKKFKLDIPIGHSGSKGARSAVMLGYQTGGTPWTVIIDKKGIVRFNGFHALRSEARQLIKLLKKE